VLNPFVRGQTYPDVEVNPGLDNIHDHVMMLTMNTENCDKVDLMLRVIEEAHRGQTSGDGFPYVLHPIRVAMNPKLYQYNKDLGFSALTDIRCAALGHDLFEDTKVTADDLLNMGFSHRTITLISLLTHKPEQSLTEYWSGIRTDSSALFIKLADIDHNTNPYRNTATPKKSWKRAVKYANAIRFLTIGIANLDLDSNEDEVWEVITSNVMNSWLWVGGNPLVKAI
jgi:(p)ppGpp synthase/HD superfamily hydrolase